jgi:hypothetical protein
MCECFVRVTLEETTTTTRRRRRRRRRRRSDKFLTDEPILPARTANQYLARERERERERERSLLTINR